MTRFRTTKAGLEIEHEQKTGGGFNGQSARKEAAIGRTTHRRYTLRNHLRSRLRQKLARQIITTSGKGEPT